jgi:tRNA threonylcarbamoyladenosine biosynthesis protein TsaB
MKILCIDTSTRHNWVGLVVDGKLISTVGYEDKQSCLINLMPSVQTALQNAQTPLSELDAIATVSGPGTWSSLRIGAATVKQLCLVNKLPLFTISNNDLLVETHLATNLPQHILAVMDAQSGKVYSALYSLKNGQAKTRISDYQWEAIDKVAESVPSDIEDLLIVGDGAGLFENHLRPNWSMQDFMPQRDSLYLATLGKLAETSVISYDRDSIMLYKPLYIQPSSAEIEFKVSVT